VPTAKRRRKVDRTAVKVPLEPVAPTSAQSAAEVASGTIHSAGANVTVQPVATYVLERSGVYYYFRPQGSEVSIEIRSPASHNEYRLSITEARALWLRLKAKGYTRF
jgi:hypothetical protein